MNNVELIKKLEERKSKLAQIEYSSCPIDPKLEEAHIRKIDNARRYRQELEGLLPFIGLTTKEIFIVSTTTFEKRVDKADYATIEDEGFFFRLALINNFPADDFLILWLTPLSSL